MSAVLFLIPFFMPMPGAQAQVTAVAPIGTPPQYNNRWEVYAGAQYSHFNPASGRNIQANNLLGWTGSATAYFRPVWGLEASVRGLYGNMTVPPNVYNVPANPKMSETLFLFGPTFRFLRGEKYAAGMHVLIGAAYGSFDSDFPKGVQPNLVGIYNNKLAFGSAIGWFTDYNLTSKLAIRGVADFQPTRYGFSMQNEFAASVGIVYKFGALKK
jgi:hypothetical protein